MVRMLVLSENLKIDEALLKVVMEANVDLCRWSEYPNIPRISDYEIVVLDLKIPNDNEYGHAFRGLRNETRILLESGGVMVCLNYFTIATNLKMYYHKGKSDLNESSIIIAEPTNWRWETNYDWFFHDNFLSKLNVAQTDAKIGRSFSLVSGDKIVAEYFKGVTEYHKTIDGVEPLRDEEGNVQGYQVSFFSGGYTKKFVSNVFAVTKVTKKPIACIVRIPKGSLIFLPQSHAKAMVMIGQLYLIGSSEYQRNIENIEERPSVPEWLSSYKTQQELDLEHEITDLTNTLQQRKLEQKRFEKIDVLLYGTGNPLEVAVQRALEEMGCTVEKLEEGATMDLKAQMDSMKFAIEVTGVDNKIHKDSKKFGQILQYLPHKEDYEKIVLLANTFRQKDVKERVGLQSFTGPVQKIARDNHFCLLTTIDLFSMWKEHLNGKSSKEPLSQLFSAEGVFKYVRKAENLKTNQKN